MFKFKCGKFFINRDIVKVIKTLRNAGINDMHTYKKLNNKYVLVGTCSKFVTLNFLTSAETVKNKTTSKLDDIINIEGKYEPQYITNDPEVIDINTFNKCINIIEQDTCNKYLAQEHIAPVINNIIANNSSLAQHNLANTLELAIESIDKLN